MIVVALGNSQKDIAAWQHPTVASAVGITPDHLAITRSNVSLGARSQERVRNLLRVHFTLGADEESDQEAGLEAETVFH